MLSLHYHELMGKTEQHEGTKIFVGWYYMLDKVLEKIKDITGIEKFDETTNKCEKTTKKCENKNLSYFYFITTF